MHKYETMYILNANQDDETIAAQIEKFSKIIADNGGAIEEVKSIGKKRMAYPIQKMNDGYYVLVNFAAGAEVPAELERNFKNDEMCLRYLIVRLDEKNA